MESKPELNNDLEAESPPALPPEEPQAGEVETTGLEETSYAASRSTRKLGGALVIGIIAIAVCLCIACLVGVVLIRPYLPFIGAKRAAARIMPTDTALFASVNVDIEDTIGYKHLAGIYGDIREVEEAIDEVLEELEDSLDISYKEDVKPWLGPEVAVAITNVEDAVEGEEPIIIIAAGTRDTKASDVFLEKIRKAVEGQGLDVDKELYKNVTYYVAEEAPLVYGTVKKFVILTSDEGAMEEVIDVVEGEADSLAENDRYAELVGTLPDDAVAYVFLDMEDLGKASLKGIEGQGLELPKEAAEQLEAFQALGAAVSLEKEGIQLDAAVTFDPDVLPPEALESLKIKASPNRILKRIPDDALGFLSGQDLAAAWKSAFASLASVPDAKEQLEVFGGALGLKIDEESLNWLSGEFAIAVVRARGTEDAPVGGFVVFEIDDQEEAADTLEGIVGALELMAGWKLEEEEIGDVEMQVLRDAYSEEITLGYGFIDKHLIIGFTEDALEDAVDDDMDSIAADETFKRVREHLPDKAAGFSYINITDAWRLAYRSMSDHEKESFDTEVRPFLEPIEAMGMVVLTDPEKGVSQSTLFLYIPGE